MQNEKDTGDLYQTITISVSMILDKLVEKKLGKAAGFHQPNIYPKLREATLITILDASQRTANS